MLPLKESLAVASLAKVLYPFLPASGRPEWKGHVTFGTVAQKVGVGEQWPAGSKEGAINALLCNVLERRRDRFERLLVEIVRAGIIYRQKKGDPVTVSEVKAINDRVFEIGFKFPELWDPTFLAALAVSAEKRADQRVHETVASVKVDDKAHKARIALAALKDELDALHVQVDRQAAGLALERLLNRLFAIFGLAPRAPFRVVGEQIDGSFELHHEIYLLEAKWESKPMSEKELLVFRGKIEGKSPFTRGVFLSLSGTTDVAQKAIVHGKQPNFFIVDGYDLRMILAGDIPLDAFLSCRQRHLSEEGAVVVSYPDLRRDEALRDR